MNISDGSEDLPDLREFLDNLPKKPCPAKLPPEYCKICKRLNREVADYCETRKLPDRMAQKTQEEPEAPEPEEEIRPAGIERAVKVQEPTQPFQRKSPLLERPDLHEGETSLEFVSSQRAKDEAKKSLPKFIPVKKKPRAFIPIEEPLPPPPDDFMAFDIGDGKPSIFRSPDSLAESEDMFTLVSGEDALEVEAITVEAEVMEATETVYQSSEGVVETVDMSGGAPDVEIEPPVFEFMAEEEPVFAEAVEVIEEPMISPESDALMDSIEEAEKGIQELVDEIAGTPGGSAEDEFALDQAMFMPTAETPEGEPAPLKKKKKKKIKKGTGQRPLKKKKKKKIKKVTEPTEPTSEEPELGEPISEEPPEEEPMTVVLPPQEPVAEEPPKKKKRMKLKRTKKALTVEAPPEEYIPEALPAESLPEEPMEEESAVEELPSEESLAVEPPKKKKKMRLKRAKKARPEQSLPEEPMEEEPAVEKLPSEESLAVEPPKKKKKMRLKRAKKAPPEEYIPEALPAESPSEESLEEEPATEEFPLGETPEDESIPEDFPSEEPAYEETVTEEPAYEEPSYEEPESSVEDLESMIMSDESHDVEPEEPAIEEEIPEEPEPETQDLEEEVTEPPAEEESVEEPAEEEGIDMEAFEPPSEAGFFFSPNEDTDDPGLGQLGLEEEEKTDFASKMKKLEKQAPGFEITAPAEPKEEKSGEEPTAIPETEKSEPRKPAKKLMLKKRKKMKMKKLRMKPRKKAEDEEASEGGEDSE